MKTSLLPTKNRKCSKFFSLFLLVIITSLFYTNLKAQEGCYVSGVLYYSPTPKNGNYFYKSPSTTGDCYVGTLSGTCYLHEGGNTNPQGNYSSYPGSYSSNISIIPCPIDDYVWMLFLVLTLGITLKFKLIKT